jgi:Phage Mu protein F like protein
MPELSIANLPFEEAIAFFKQKVPLPTSAWDEIINEAQDWAFTVAGLTKAEMLADIYQAIEQALEEGTKLEDFTRKFDETAARYGWEPPPGKEGLWGGWRMQLIYMQNLQSSYAAGRLAQMRDPDVARSRPYWLWRHRDSRSPRPAHLALDGKVFRGDSVFWQVGYPPCGYGCKCGVYALTEDDVQRRGLKVEDAPTERVTLRDRITGKEFKVPAINGQPIVEPGFVHAPGSSVKEQRRGILARSLRRLPVALRRQARSEIGRRDAERVDFAAKRGGHQPNCSKGYSCGSSCIAKTKTCAHPLEGQARNYADWLALQIQSDVSSLSIAHKAEAIERDLWTPKVQRLSKSDIPEIFHQIYDAAYDENFQLTQPETEDVKSFLQSQTRYDQTVKIQKIRDADPDISEAEATGLATYFTHGYRTMNTEALARRKGQIPYLNPQTTAEREANELHRRAMLANAAATSALRKLPPPTIADLQEMDASYRDRDRLLRYIPTRSVLPYEAKYIPGRFILEAGFTAASVYQDPERLKSYSENAQVIFRIRALPVKTTKSRGLGNTKGKKVDHFKNSVREGEVLFPPLTRFYISKVDRDSTGRLIINMEEAEEV